MKKAEKTRSQIGRMSRNKGKRMEREARDQINYLFGRHCRRGQQRSGADEQDLVDHFPGLWIEVKGQQRPNIQKALEQADTDINQQTTPRHSAFPVVLSRQTGKKWWLFTCYLEDLPGVVDELAEALEEMRKEST